MRRLMLVFVAVAIGLGIAMAAKGPEHAYACSGPGPASVIPFEPRVMEARVVALDALPWTGGDTPGPRPYRVMVEVTKAYRGVAVGERLTMDLTINQPGYPQPCPFPEIKTNSLGKWFVGAFNVESNYISPLFVGLDPSGPEYESTSALMEILTGSNPARPALRLEPAAPVCGERVRIVGSGFAPGAYIVRYGTLWPRRLLAAPEVGADGTFVAEAPFVNELCRRADGPNTVEFRASLRQPPPGDQLGGLIASVAGTFSGATDRKPEYPELTIVEPFSCDRPVSVRGTGFEAGESLLVGMPGTVLTPITVRADASGAFATAVTLPPDACLQQGHIQLFVAQGGFGVPFEDAVLTSDDAWAAPGGATAPTAPGPPNAGEGTAAHGMDWRMALTWAVAIAVLAEFTFATVRRGAGDRRRTRD